MMENYMRLHKRFFAASLALGVLTAQGFAAEPKPVPAAPALSVIYALVNGDEIAQPEFDAEWSGLLAQAKKVLKPEQMTAQWEKTEKQMLLNQLVDRRLLAQEAKKKGITVPKKDVETAVRKVKSQFKPAEDFQKELARENITEKQFSARIEGQLKVAALTDGVIRERAKQITTEQVRKLFDSVKERMGRTDKSDAAEDAQQAELTGLARYFKTNTSERVRIQYILFKADDKSAPEQRAAAAKKAEEVKAKLDAGADFYDIAVQYSEDKATGPKGGEAGYIVRGQLARDFEDAVFAIPVGAVSGVIETKIGYQLIRVEEKTAAVYLRYEMAREYLTNYLERAAANEALKGYIQELRKTAVIELRADFARS